MEKLKRALPKGLQTRKLQCRNSEKKLANEDISAMKLKEIMTPDVAIVHRSATLQEVAIKMKDLDVGLIPVCDGDWLCGTLTDRDITVRAMAYGWGPNTPVETVMTQELVYAFEDEDEENAAKLMEERQIRRLIILNGDERLVGIVSLGDLATRIRREQLSGEALEKVSPPIQSKSI